MFIYLKLEMQLQNEQGSVLNFAVEVPTLEDNVSPNAWAVNLESEPEGLIRGPPDQGSGLLVMWPSIL